MNSYGFWLGHLDWDRTKFVRWIVLCTRDKDWDLRTNKERIEIENSKPGRKTEQIIARIPVATEEEFEATEGRVTTVCNILGARAYLLPNKVYHSKSVENLLNTGISYLFPPPPDSTPIDHFKEVAIVGNLQFISESYDWFEKGWWFELDCDTPTTGGHVEDWIAEKDKAVKTIKKLVRISELYELPSKTGIHIYFKMSKSYTEFPVEKYKKIMKEECTFHDNAVANLYIPDRRYYPIGKAPVV